MTIAKQRSNPMGVMKPRFPSNYSPARAKVAVQRQLRRGIPEMEKKMTESDKLGLINMTASDECRAIAPSPSYSRIAGIR
jgi:hypothetical protein